MQVPSVPLGSVQIGPACWHDATLQSIQRAQRLVQQTWEEQPRSPGSTRKVQPGGSADEMTSVAPYPSNRLREKCAAETVAVVGQYMRQVREVEARLRRQVGSVSTEWTRLEREKVHLEKTLCSIRNNLCINCRSSQGRPMRPSFCEKARDGADRLLEMERRELRKLERDLEAALNRTQRQLQVLAENNRKLQSCASERAQVLDLLPKSCSAGPNDSSAFIKAEPCSHFTPECKQALDSSSLAISQSRQLREDARRLVSSTIGRLNEAHQCVNNGLTKKIAETVDLQQNLALATGTTRQAVYRKQREIKFLRYSHNRAQAPECLRERQDRPVLQVYQRHPGTELCEAACLYQGSVALKRRLQASKGELMRLQCSGLQLLEDMRRKTGAAQVDTAVVHMRREQVDRRAVPAFLQREALTNWRSAGLC